MRSTRSAGSRSCVSALIIGYRVYVLARHRLLWRVRRKLILSYIFIGVVPVLLVAIFFTLGGLLFFFNVSAFMLRNHVTSVVDGAQFLAQAAAPTLEATSTAAQLTRGLAARQTAAAARYPFVSYALVPSDRALRRRSRSASRRASSPDPGATSRRRPRSQTGCRALGLRASSPIQAEGGTRIAARAIAWPPGLRSALIVDIPFGDALIREFHDEMGITIEAYSIVERCRRSAIRRRRRRSARGRLVVGPVNIRLGEQQEPLGWVAFLDYTDWKTGEMSALTVGFRMGLAAVYRYLSGPSFAPLDNFNLGQIFLILLAVDAGLFLVIQAVALVMGLTLARSITGSVHELFAGTERVRRGDFGHKIAIRSRDQLGDLAGSFNSMTASIEGLLRRKSGEGAPGAGAADCPEHPDVTAAAGTVPDAWPYALRALRASARSGRRLLRLSAAGERSPWHPDRRRRGEGHVGRALHGGAQGAGALAQPAPRVAASDAHRGQSASSPSISTRAASSR